MFIISPFFNILKICCIYIFRGSLQSTCQPSLQYTSYNCCCSWIAYCVSHQLCTKLTFAVWLSVGVILYGFWWHLIGLGISSTNWAATWKRLCWPEKCWCYLLHEFRTTAGAYTLWKHCWLCDWSLAYKTAKKVN